MPGTLYVVATPIGNLGDITLRALETLKKVDLVVCEDTRITRRLLARFGISKPTLSHFAGNEGRRTPDILQRIAGGEEVALVTDSGSPALSDPGYLLVRACREASLPVFSVPGPSALAAGISVSGLPSSRVLFLGFPPRKRGERMGLYRELSAAPYTLVFYESPRRVRTLLAEFREHLPGRGVAVLRELTKRFESCYIDPGPEDVPERGEFTLVLGPPGDRAQVETPPSPAALEDEVARLREEGVDRREALRRVAKERGLSRRALYQLLIRRPPCPS